MRTLPARHADPATLPHARPAPANHVDFITSYREEPALHLIYRCTSARSCACWRPGQLPGQLLRATRLRQQQQQQQQGCGPPAPHPALLCKLDGTCCITRLLAAPGSNVSTWTHPPPPPPTPNGYRPCCHPQAAHADLDRVPCTAAAHQGGAIVVRSAEMRHGGDPSNALPAMWGLQPSAASSPRTPSTQDSSCANAASATTPAMTDPCPKLRSSPAATPPFVHPRR